MLDVGLPVRLRRKEHDAPKQPTEWRYHFLRMQAAGGGVCHRQVEGHTRPEP